MKKLRSSISLLLCVLLLFGTASAAFAAERELAPSGLILSAEDDIETVVCFSDGAEYTVSGTVDMTETERNPVIERVDLFEVRYDGDAIMTIEPHDIAATGASYEASNGYYALTFTLPDYIHEVFLTGLTPEKVDTVQADISAAYKRGDSFDLTDIDFIDAEKLSGNFGDSNLCWAGTVSNMLHYSGWGRKVGFGTEDDIFDVYMESFMDLGNFEPNGLEWFFNGSRGSLASDNIIKDYPNSGAYLPEYDISSLYEYRELDTDDYAANMKLLRDDIMSGDAVGLSIQFDQEHAHAITCWGGVTNKQYPDDDPKHYTAMFVVDSDDDIQNMATDRRTAPNRLCMSPILEIDDENGEYFGYPQTAHVVRGGALRDYTSLTPYSDSVPTETDPKATLDRINTPDLRINDGGVSPVTENDDITTTVAAEGQVYLVAELCNFSDVDFYDSVDFDITVYQHGDKLLSLSDNKDIVGSAYEKSILSFDIGKLKAGDYSAEITVDPQKTLSEAYYCNNTYTYDFTVIVPEFDISDTVLGVSLNNKLNEIYEHGVVDYEGVPEGLLIGAESAVFAESQLMDGWWSDYNEIFADEYDERNPVLPAGFEFSKEGSRVRFRLILRCRGIDYILSSSEYELRSAGAFILFAPDNTDFPSVLPYGSTSMNDEEQLSFFLNNISINYDEELKGAFSIGYIEKNGQTDEEILMSEPREVTIPAGGQSQKYVIRSWDKPIDKTRSIFVFVDIDTEDGVYHSRFYLCDFRVPENGSNIVDIGYDENDPCDGLTSLREAISYCAENGLTDIEIADNITELNIDDTLTIDSAVNIVVDTNSPITLRQTEKQFCNLFRVEKGGSLTLSGIFLRLENSCESFGAIICDGGEVHISDCRFNQICSEDKGGALYMNGGYGSFKNCLFSNMDTPKGTVAYIEGGAKLELLNCLADYALSQNSVVENVDGTLNIINSTIVNTVSFSDSAVTVLSSGQTNIINSVLIKNRTMTDVSGTADLYSTAYSAIDDGVTADEFSKVYDPNELFVVSYLDNPRIAYAEDSLYAEPMIIDKITEGSYTTVRNGEICISRDNESFISTGVKTAFTAEELAYDAVGHERGSEFGSYSELYVESYLLGDIDGDDDVNVVDAAMAQRYDAQMLNFYPGEFLSHGDVDADGEVTIMDVTWIQRYLALMKVKYPIGERIVVG